MLNTVELKTDKKLKAIVLAAFPSYKKHKAFVSEFKGEVNINSYWDGGSKSEYAIVDVETMQRKRMPNQTHPSHDIVKRGMTGAETQDIRVDHVGNVYLKHLPEGFALVSAGTFCGKAATAHIYFPGQPAIETTAPEVKQIGLVAE